jgi:S-adenosylmethionine:tRNA ribosyltransferase-isomerase
VLGRASGALHDRQFHDLPDLLSPGDLLVVNDTRVFPARLRGRRLPGGGGVECFLVRRIGHEGAAEIWEALVHPGQRLKPGTRMEFAGEAASIHGEVLERHFHGRRTVKLWTESESIDSAVDVIGHVPLPPYIKRNDHARDHERYQTVYADRRGSIAAPTAGLHFTADVLEAVRARGIQVAAITLHVGYGTFQPIRVQAIEDHRVEPEEYEVSPIAAGLISQAFAEKRRIVAVGTTTTRTLESLTIAEDGQVMAGRSSTDLFIHPGHPFRVVSGLVTNFHLPKSSLLMLVAAFAGRESVLNAYAHAVAKRYRFYSYGDAMLIL